jgi:predicted enzyme related to lactoylglutathione lyase
MNTGPFPSVVLFVAAVERVASFYKAVASMQFVSGDGDHAVLEIDGFQLVIHKLRGEPDPIHDSQGRVRVREDTYSKLCLPVQSIDVARSQADAFGGYIKPAEHEWRARGFRACDGNDPEGNVIQIRESAA